MSLTVVTTTDGNTALLTCEGRVVLGTAVELRDKARVALASGAKNIVADLGGVDYMDSSGIGELVSAYTGTRNSGGELVLARLSKRVRDLLTITRLITVFQIFETSDEALEYLRGRAAAGSEANHEPKL